MGNTITLNTITIREKSKDGETFNITVSFNNGPEHAVSMKDPFDLDTERLFEWYFEEHLKFSFIDKVKAKRAAKAISNYSEDLFEQVFGERTIYSKYKRFRDSD